MGPPDRERDRPPRPVPNVSAPTKALNVSTVADPGDNQEPQPGAWRERLAADLEQRRRRRERQAAVRAGLAEARRHGLRARHRRKLARGGGA